jgi:DNA invertase Pin-like site-specific DNA recombinase
VTKAFAYLRVSGKGQVGGDGFPRQLETIRRYAQANEIRIAREFREKGVSGGTDLGDRPALSEMREALLSNGVRLVLIERLDRLARDLMVQESILADFRKHGFEVVSVSEPDLLQDDPTRVLMRQLLGAFFQYEKTLIVNKLRGARNRIRVKEGRCEGRKPYGHLEGERAVIDRMTSLRRDGMSYERIAAELNNAAIPTRKAGKQWFGSTVNGILAARAKSPENRYAKRGATRPTMRRPELQSRSDFSVAKRSLDCKNQ